MRLFLNVGQGYTTTQAEGPHHEGTLLAAAGAFGGNYAVVELEVDTLILREATEMKLIAVHGLKPKPPVVTKKFKLADSRGRIINVLDEADDTAQIVRDSKNAAAVLLFVFEDDNVVDVEFISREEFLRDA